MTSIAAAMTIAGGRLGDTPGSVREAGGRVLKSSTFEENRDDIRHDRIATRKELSGSGTGEMSVDSRTGEAVSGVYGGSCRFEVGPVR